LQAKGSSFKKEKFMRFQTDLTFRSFEPESLANALEMVRKIININSFNKSPTIFGLPKKTQRWTLLRSPHVHKKSREQFEMPTHQAVLRAYWSTKEELKVFLLTLQNTEIYGVQIHLEISSSMYFTSTKKKTS
jgi:small subunit ribosomal protein S10